MQRASHLELRFSRSGLARTAVIGLALIADGLLLRDFARWLALAMGAASLIATVFAAANGLPRLTLSEVGIEARYVLGKRWVSWTTVGSMWEIKTRRRFPRSRLLAITFIGARGGSSAARFLYGADCALQITDVDRQPEDVLTLVEQYSGKPVRRFSQT